MARSQRLLIVGGSGVFGRLLARELLATTSAQLVLAGRDLSRVTAAARSLDDGDRVEALRLDLSDSGALGRAAATIAVVVCAAGPFQPFPPDLPVTAVRAGAHWLDLSDDPIWIRRLLADAVLAEEAAATNRAVIPGLSTVPTLSGALVRWCLARRPTATTARVTLYIGNRNGKGAGAIASALLAGLSDPIQVDLPFGRRLAFRFGDVDPVLWRPGEIGPAAELRVAFELAPAARLVAVLSQLTCRWTPSSRRRVASTLAWIAAPLGSVGSSIGCLQAEVFDGGGGRLARSLISPDQRMAILPLAIAVESFLASEAGSLGVVHPLTWRTADTWLDLVQRRGLRWTRV